jgi:hypothetical protein
MAGPHRKPGIKPNHPDTQPDKTEGNSATYNTSKDVEINTNFDDPVTEHHVTAPGQVTIHKSNYSNSVEVTRQGDTLVCTVTGDDGKQEIYYIDNASKVVLDFLSDKITGDAKDDPKIEKGSADAGTATPPSEKAQALAGIVGKTPDEIQQEITKEGLDLDNSTIPDSTIFDFLRTIDQN